MTESVSEPQEREKGTDKQTLRDAQKHTHTQIDGEWRGDTSKSNVEGEVYIRSIQDLSPCMAIRLL